jgi:hypothetical protein
LPGSAAVPLGSVIADAWNLEVNLKTLFNFIPKLFVSFRVSWSISQVQTSFVDVSCFDIFWSEEWFSQYMQAIYRLCTKVVYFLSGLHYV